MTATHERIIRASLEELQAAAAAAQRGDFALHRAAARTIRAAEDPRPHVPASPLTSDPSRWRPGGAVVAVAAGHSGAGASTVAVTLAEALAGRNTAVRIVEISDAARSGLAAASSAELGEDGTGWRRGRRGDIHIDRLTCRVAAIRQVPPPGPGRLNEVLILDVGWPARDALAADGWVAAALAASALLIVCRPTVPGIRQTEYLLADLAEYSAVPVTLAAVGPARWPGAAAASAGPQVRMAREGGRVITIPIDRRVETDGISAEALPKALAAAGKALAAALPSTASNDHPIDQPALGRAG